MLRPDPENRTVTNATPNLVKAAVEKKLKAGGVTGNLLVDAAKFQEADQVRPLFNSVRYGTPVYCQFADCCA